MAIVQTFYREIDALNPPYDGGLDVDRRRQYGFNIVAVKKPSDHFLEELFALLEEAGVGARNVDIFGTTGTTLPSGDGPYLVIVESGGLSGERKHNDTTMPDFERPSALVMVHGNSVVQVRRMARAAYSKLVGVRNRTVSTTVEE